jgi:hypothetical protein
LKNSCNSPYVLAVPERLISSTCGTERDYLVVASISFLWGFTIHSVPFVIQIFFIGQPHENARLSSFLHLCASMPGVC